MSTLPKDRSPLLPDRHPTPDFFVCDIFDAAASPRGDMASMEHPVFSLSTKPDYRVRKYENNGNFIEVKPSADGLATVHDRDVLIFCISQLMAAVNAGRPISQVVRFKAHDLLKATNRMTNGQGYQGLKAAFERLAGTRIVTNIVTGGELHRGYFRLRKPLERRIYEIARKHCGKQREWKISLEKLQLKCGSCSTLKEFRRLVGAIVEEDQAHHHIPGLGVHLRCGRDCRDAQREHLGKPRGSIQSCFVACRSQRGRLYSPAHKASL